MLDNGNARERETIDNPIDNRKLSVSAILDQFLHGLEVDGVYELRPDKQQ